MRWRGCFFGTGSKVRGRSNSQRVARTQALTSSVLRRGWPLQVAIFKRATALRSSRVAESLGRKTGEGTYSEGGRYGIRSARSPVGKTSKWMGRTSARHFASAILSFSLSADRLSCTERRALIVSYANGFTSVSLRIDSRWPSGLFPSTKYFLRCWSQIVLLDPQSVRRRQRLDCGDRYGDGKHF